MVESFVLVTLSWLFPGLGFVIKKKYVRGIAIFFIVSLTFGIAIFMHGQVVFPETTDDFGANAVIILSFVVQLGNGFMSLFCLLVPVKGIPYHPLFELASFYLVVSGAMNYFAVCNFYDRFYKKPTPIENKEYV